SPETPASFCARLAKRASSTFLRFSIVLSTTITAFAKQIGRAFHCPPDIILLNSIAEAVLASSAALPAVEAAWAYPATTAGPWSARHRRGRCAAPGDGAPHLLPQRS